MSTAMDSTATTSPSDLVLVGHVLDAQGDQGFGENQTLFQRTLGFILSTACLVI